MIFSQRPIVYFDLQNSLSGVPLCDYVEAALRDFVAWNLWHEFLRFCWDFINIRIVGRRTNGCFVNGAFTISFVVSSLPACFYVRV